MPSSTRIGQGALRPLPLPIKPPPVATATAATASSGSSSSSLAAYHVPPELKAERKSLTGSKAGIEVYKVAKNGKLVPRRIALSLDNRAILVTSNKIKSIRGLFKALTPQSQEVTSRSIDLSCVERIERDQQTNRFIAARSMDKLPSRSEGSADDEGNCFSIIYRASTREAASFTDVGISVPNVVVGSNIHGDSGGGNSLNKSSNSSSNNKALLVAPHRFDTLDLLVPKDEDYELLIRTLQDLMALYHEERKTYDNFSLFLQYQWIELGKELTSRLSISEWITLCDRANVPLSKSQLQSHFKDFCEDRGVEEEGLFLTEAAELLAEVRETSLDVSIDEDDPLTKLWNELMESDPIPPVTVESDQTDLEMEVSRRDESLSSVALLGFLRSQQKEFTTTLEDVRLLVSVLNSQTLLEETSSEEDDDDECRDLGSDRIRKARFVSLLLSDANDIVNPECAMVGGDDMNQSLTNYWINTSHDTYLSKIPNSFRFKDMDFEGHIRVHTQAYTNALYRGIRCLELDIFDGIFGGPVVARRKPTSPSDNQSITFAQVLKSVRSFLRNNSATYPIILLIECHCSLVNQSLMAKHLKEILDSEGMLFTPTQDILNNESHPLPSPHALRGKVVVKNKRPKVMRTGASILNDDFDEENDLPIQVEADKTRSESNVDGDEEDEDLLGAVIRFEAGGPIRSADRNANRTSPEVLLQTARQEVLEAKQAAARAAAKEEELKGEAAAADSFARSAIEASGLSDIDLQERAMEENKVASGEEAGDHNLIPRSTKAGSKDGLQEPSDEGVEVQDFFGNAVDGARSGHSEADANALASSNLAAQALERLNDAEKALTEAEVSLEESYRDEKRKAEAAQRAANDVRVNREHAEIARRRVETVQGLLKNSKSSASSAESVVMTAMTEAKISEQRAQETEARAARALTMAEKERIRADVETKQEETFEHEAAGLHDLVGALTKEAYASRQRMEKAASMLDKINEQIKLIERSSQFQREVTELDGSSQQDGTPRHGGSFVAKHRAKLNERQICTEQMKEAVVANQSFEMRRKRVQAAFEEKAHLWKMQADVASQARKQADRSSQHAEELAEHAEEEREAASLRHIACEKAKKSVTISDDYQTSIQAQLIEASRASEEAASLALESRILADKLAREAEFAKDHAEAMKHVANTKVIQEEADIAYQAALEKKLEADSNVLAAKRLLDTSAEVFSNAKRDAATELNNAIVKRQLERDAVKAFRNAQLARQVHESSALQTKMMHEAASDKVSAASQALEYKLRMDRLSPISLDLALLTFLHSSKFKNWEKSESLPNSYMHSISAARITCMLGDDVNGINRQHFLDFTKDHFVRTFPPWRLVSKNKCVNYNPVEMQGLGCQLVAMNYHSSDEHILLNEGRFRANGSCGYVLKPPQLSLGVERAETWKFTILCGTCLPPGEKAMGRKFLAQGSMHYISPYVRVSLYQGTDDDGKDGFTHQTAHANRNGLNPIWKVGTNETEFTVKRPSVAMVMFTVWDSLSGDFIAGSAVPISRIRAGYRSVALFDSIHSRSGPYAFASLLVKVHKVS